jgi:hypothetical protein
MLAGNSSIIHQPYCLKVATFAFLSASNEKDETPAQEWFHARH